MNSHCSEEGGSKKAQWFNVCNVIHTNVSQMAIKFSLKSDNKLASTMPSLSIPLINYAITTSTYQ